MINMSDVLFFKGTIIMPELLLSSAKVQNSSPSSLSNGSLSNSALPNRTKESPMYGVSNPIDAKGMDKKAEAKFNNILSSVVDKPNTQGSENLMKSDLKALGEAIDNILHKLEEMDPDSETLIDIRAFLDGQDLSSLSVDGLGDGLNLPGFLSELGSMIQSLMNQVDDSMSAALDKDITGLEAAFLQLNSVVNKITTQAQGFEQNSAGSASALLGFSFDSGKGKSGQWQRYDPQQMSQTSNVAPSSGNPINTFSQGLTPDGLVSDGLVSDGMVSKSLVSETDQSFQAEMDQLINSKVLDNSDLTDSISETLTDAKDKAALKFSDLQLKTPNETLKQYSTTLSSPVNSEQWSDEVSQKILWFAGRNIQSAEMHLNPADLGPIDVKIHVQNDVATVTFNVNNASVRDLLESNVVRLREMMEANGVNVGDVNIDSDSREQSQQSNSDSTEKGFSQSGNESDESADLVMTEKEITIKQSNLVDYFV